MTQILIENQKTINLKNPEKSCYIYYLIILRPENSTKSIAKLKAEGNKKFSKNIKKKDILSQHPSMTKITRNQISKKKYLDLEDSDEEEKETQKSQPEETPKIDTEGTKNVKKMLNDVFFEKSDVSDQNMSQAQS